MEKDCKERTREALEKLAYGFEYEEREIIIDRSGKQTGKVRVRKRYQPPNMEALFAIVQQEE